MNSRREYFRQWRERNKERLCLQHEEKKRDPKWIARFKKYQREYYRKNKERRLAYAKAWFKKTYPDRKQKYYESARKWRAANKGKYRAAQKNWLKTEKGKWYLKQYMPWWLSKTTKGSAYVVRSNYGLPSNAPDELIQTCQLLSAIRKEMRNEHHRA